MEHRQGPLEHGEERADVAAGDAGEEEGDPAAGERAAAERGPAEEVGERGAQHDEPRAADGREQVQEHDEQRVK